MIGAYERLGSPCFCIYLEVQSLVLNCGSSSIIYRREIIKYCMENFIVLYDISTYFVYILFCTAAELS